MCINMIISRVQAVTTVLDAFGSCRTGSNMAATKFSQIFSVDFDRSGAIVSASIQVRYLLLVGDGFESLPKTASRLKTLNQWRAQCLLGGGKPWGSEKKGGQAFLIQFQRVLLTLLSCKRIPSKKFYYHLLINLSIISLSIYLSSGNLSNYLGNDVRTLEGS